MKKGISIFTILLILIPFLSACWNQKELTDLAFVMALGIDKGKDKRFKLSFQLVNPGNVSSGQNGGGDGQGLPIAVYRSTGDSLTQATRNVTKMVSRRIYFAHTNLVVISEEIAKEDMDYILDALDRDPEFRITSELVVAKDCTAEDLVSTLTPLDKLPVNKITKQIKSTETMLGENMSRNIDDFLSGLVSKGKQPFVNGYGFKGNKQKARSAKFLQNSITDASLSSEGLAIFNGTKLRGWVDGDEARGIIWLQDKLKSTYIYVNWKKKKNAIVVAPIRSKTKVSVQYIKERPVINIKIDSEGWISEANTPIDLNNPEIISEIDKLVEIEISKEILTSVKATQKLKCDILGFGEKVHVSNPKLWKKLEKNWDNEFAELQVNAKVDFYIRREGIRTLPFWSDMGK
ncbi:Ger(x)C family spore germination protein [Neobacillus cucumis]|uniref:Ger(x)C family spore germination protein n=1 Tax=Neobacillus cucumis TaxID=1740721 RepID=UPI001962629F|nr:Ger(x)C family spore germination protein [Neobacillus cucumis]MBM7654179.1 spore germination protein KC [Neobacillus cucumis]